MPAMDMFQKTEMVQTPKGEPVLVNMASSMVPESRNHTLGQTPTHIRKSVGDAALKEKLSCGGPMA